MENQSINEIKEASHERVDASHNGTLNVLKKSNISFLKRWRRLGTATWIKCPIFRVSSLIEAITDKELCCRSEACVFHSIAEQISSLILLPKGFCHGQVKFFCVMKCNFISRCDNFSLRNILESLNLEAAKWQYLWIL